MRENEGPPWGLTESPIVGDLLRRIMPLDEPVNLSVGRSRAASMRRSIIPKLRDIRVVAGTRPIEGYYDHAAPFGYVNQDQITLCSGVRFFPFLTRTKGTCSLRPRMPLKIFESVLRTTTGSTYPKTLRDPIARTAISGSTRFDIRLKRKRSIYIILAMIIVELRTFNAR